MANQNQQGTGRHGHKDTKEPWPHHGGSDSRREEQQQQQQAGSREQGSGGSGSRSQGRGDGGRSESGSGNRSPAGAKEHPLESREYRGEDGETHHHTNTYMEQHKGHKDERKDER